MRNRGAQILWLAVLLTVAAAMGILLIGGDILLYLSPRMVPVVWFGFIVMASLAVFQIWQIIAGWKNHERKIRLGNLIFLIPVILMLTVTPDKNTSGTLPNQNVKLVSMVKSTPQADETVVLPSPTASVEPSSDAQQTQTSAAPSQSPATAAEEQADAADAMLAADAAPCVYKEGTVPFDDATTSFSNMLYASAQDLAGKNVKLCGYVYKDAAFPENTVLLSRLFISCCTADASVVGFHVRVENADDFENDEWVCVQGTIQTFSMDYNGEEYALPILTGGTISRCDAPKADEAYIYP